MEVLDLFELKSSCLYHTLPPPVAAVRSSSKSGIFIITGHHPTKNAVEKCRTLDSKFCVYFSDWVRSGKLTRHFCPLRESVDEQIYERLRLTEASSPSTTDVFWRAMVTKQLFVLGRRVGKRRQTHPACWLPMAQRGPPVGHHRVTTGCSEAGRVPVRQTSAWPQLPLNGPISSIPDGGIHLIWAPKSFQKFSLAAISLQNSASCFWLSFGKGHLLSSLDKVKPIFILQMVEQAVVWENMPLLKGLEHPESRVSALVRLHLPDENRRNNESLLKGVNDQGSQNQKDFGPKF
ncbi:MAG: hypothetical protein IPM82_21425 [Saprospiraceae bacterium]|nr:hypothetical protein [Saprospiraceae bacterium]